MQSANIIQKQLLSNPTLSLRTSSGHLVQIRNHVKIYPWRHNRKNSESYLDNTRTPYTDRLNSNEFDVKKSQKKPWQIVIPKNRDHQYNSYKWNDSYRSDPKEARETAQSKLNRLRDSLRSRGQARESKAYDPPGNVEEAILKIYKSCTLDGDQVSGIQEAASDETILDISLEQSRTFKINLLTKCIHHFGHDIPNSHLNDLTTIGTLVEYFSTPVRGINPYSALLRQENSLPANLTLISEPLRYNRESDDFFKGYSAYPGIVGTVPGLRASKKYPILNQDEFQWPDI